MRLRQRGERLPRSDESYYASEAAEKLEKPTPTAAAPIRRFFHFNARKSRGRKTGAEVNAPPERRSEAGGEAVTISADRHICKEVA